jgi:hypothetical protein
MIDCECEKELIEAEEHEWETDLVYCSRFCFASLEERLKNGTPKQNETN